MTTTLKTAIEPTAFERTTTRVSFVEPLPGFDEDRFTLDAIDDSGVLYSLRSERTPDLRFVLTRAAAFFPRYVPPLPDALAAVLGSDEVEVLLVLTLGTSLAEATANLRAPVVHAPASGRAVQVILDDDALPMRAPLLPTA
jgi:flagellar assembly factor FliW